MYSHVTVGTNDYAAAKAFYDAILPLLGLQCIHADADEGAAGWAVDADRAPHFWLVRPFDRQAATVGNGVTVGKSCFIGANALVTQSTADDQVFITESTKPFRLTSRQFMRMSKFTDL